MPITLRYRHLARVGIALLTLPLLLAPARAAAEPIPRAEIVAYGEFRGAPRKGVQEAPNTALGWVGVVDGTPSLIARTAEIVAAEGIRFGIIVEVPGLAPGETLPVTVRLDHPPMTAPDGRVWRTQTSESVIAREPYYRVFCFDYAWELVPGEWTYTLLHRGSPIASQRFHVTVDPAKKAESRCSGEAAVSWGAPHPRGLVWARIADLPFGREIVAGRR